MAEATITIEITRAINRLEEGHIKIPYFAGQVVKVTEETAKTAVAEGWGKVVRAQHAAPLQATAPQETSPPGAQQTSPPGPLSMTGEGESGGAARRRKG